MCIEIKVVKQDKLIWKKSFNPLRCMLSIIRNYIDNVNHEKSFLLKSIQREHTLQDLLNFAKLKN